MPLYSDEAVVLRTHKLAEADPVAYHGPGKFDPKVGITAPATPPRTTLVRVVEKIAVPGMSAPRSGDQPPQAVRFSSGHSGSGTESIVKPASTRRRTQSLIVRWCSA